VNRSGPKHAMFSDLASVSARHAGLMKDSPRTRALVVTVVVLLTGLALFALLRLEFSLGRIGTGLAQLAHFISLMFPPSPGTQLSAFLTALGETVAIAFLGTLFAAICSFPIAFLASRNVMPVRVVQFMTRRFSDTIRGVDTLIWALIWINVVGLGPFAGVLAILTSDIGSFIKLFSEAVEAIDNKPREGVIASGGSDLHGVCFGIVPQVLPVLISQVLYYFESNTRSATIIGIVGAGGIGLHLAEMIRTYEWDQVSFIILMILITVAVIDLVSSRLRTAIIGKRTAAI